MAPYYDGFGFSPLDQITKDNVKDLQVAWSWSLTNGATESTPIVHDGVLYIWNYADKVQALNAATGDLIWEYRRDLPQGPSIWPATSWPSATWPSIRTNW